MSYLTTIFCENFPNIWTFPFVHLWIRISPHTDINIDRILANRDRVKTTNVTFSPASVHCLRLNQGKVLSWAICVSKLAHLLSQLAGSHCVSLKKDTTFETRNWNKLKIESTIKLDNSGI